GEHCRLRREALEARQQLESRIHCLQSAREAIRTSQERGTGTPQLQRARLQTEQQGLQSLMEDARQKERQLAEALQELRATAEGQQQQLRRAQARNEELVAESQAMAAKHVQAAQAASSLVEERQRQKRSNQQELDGCESMVAAAQAALVEQRRRDSEALQAEQRRQVEEIQEAETTLWALRSRLDDASTQLEGEQERNARLRQEVMATEAAADMSNRLGWTEPTTPQSARAEAGAVNHGWAKTKSRLDVELGQLRRWKEEAARAVERMAAGLRDVRQRYDQQVKYGQDLRQTLARTGKRVESITGLSPGQAPGSRERETPMAGPPVKPPPSKAKGWWHHGGNWRAASGDSCSARQAVRAPARPARRSASREKELRQGHRVQARLLS
ncbi:unnamed protein product, partial [Effrenium voratum]